MTTLSRVSPTPSTRSKIAQIRPSRAAKGTPASPASPAPQALAPASEAPKGVPQVSADAVPTPTTLGISVNSLAAALAVAAKADARSYLNGVYLSAVGTELRVVATDGHRILVQTVVLAGADLAARAWLEAGVILPRAELDRVVKFVGTGDEAMLDVSYAAGDSSVALRDRFGLAQFAIKPVDGIYPDYQKIISAAGAAFHGERVVAEALPLNPAYLKSAGQVAAILQAGAIYSFMDRASSHAVFTFDKAPGALLVMMPVQTEVPALQGATLRLIGESGMKGTIAALKAHATRARKAADAIKGKEPKAVKEREALQAQAARLQARVHEILTSVTKALPAPRAESEAKAA